MESRKVVLLGLKYTIVDLYAIQLAKELAGVPVWTMNDFWLFYPKLEPDGIFQVHDPERLPLGKNGRWIGNYRTIYNHHDCKVYCCWYDDGLDNQWYMSDCMLSRHFPMHLYQCTVVYMMAQAMEEGFNHIIFEGMMFDCDGERASQLPYIVEAINHARDSGVVVEIDPRIEKQWRKHLDRSKPDWESLRTVEPYHVRESGINLKLGLKPDQLKLN